MGRIKNYKKVLPFDSFKQAIYNGNDRVVRGRVLVTDADQILIVGDIDDNDIDRFTGTDIPQYRGIFHAHDGDVIPGLYKRTRDEYPSKAKNLIDYLNGIRPKNRGIAGK